jgi:hypothetical protein
MEATSSPPTRFESDDNVPTSPAQSGQRYDVGPCPVCGDGLRGVRICCGTPVILCDECDATWSSPALTDRLPASTNPVCRECGESLWGEQSHWATHAEIEAAGWWPEVRRSTEDVPRVSAADRYQPGVVYQGAIFVLLLLGAAVAALAVL